MLGYLNFAISLFILFKLMAKEEQYDAAFARIDEATNKVADELRELKEEIAGQGLPGDVEDRILAKLEEKATKLESIGTTPEPEPQPQPEPNPEQPAPETPEEEL